VGRESKEGEKKSGKKMRAGPKRTSNGPKELLKSATYPSGSMLGSTRAESLSQCVCVCV
jgi:hypothetical protein